MRKLSSFINESSNSDETNEDIFIKLLKQNSFRKEFKESLLRYIKDNNIDDEVNDFTILPFIEIEYKNDTYSVYCEFESAVQIKKEDDKITEINVVPVKSIKYMLPKMETMTKLESADDLEFISKYIMDCIKSLKNNS
jgi:hypothetical protein